MANAIDWSKVGDTLKNVGSKVGGVVASNAGSLLTAGLSGVISHQSAYRQFKYQRALQNHAYDLNLKSLQESPSATRQGLESAGYNPMLAVSNGTYGSNAGSISAGNSTAPDYSSMISNALDFQRVKNETASREAQVENFNADSRDKNASAANKEAENPYIAPRQKAEIGKTQAETAHIGAMIDNMKARLELDRQLGFMGLDVQRRGQDKVYNASTYASNVSELNNIRQLNSTEHNFGLGKFYKYTKRNSNWK